MDSHTQHPIQYQQYSAGEWTSHPAQVIVEKPVSLTINGVEWLTFRCTPVDLEALALGFLFNEGLIQDMNAIASVRACKNRANVDVWLNFRVEKPERWQRTSGCTGGMTSLEAGDNPDCEQAARPHLYNGAILTPDQVNRLTAALLENQDLYRQSGGVHTSALSDGERLVVVAEDIGRHNTLDKIAGRAAAR